MSSLKDIRRTAEKLGVTKLQRDSLLDTFQKLAYSRNLDEYETNKKLLQDKKISAADSYFRNSWDSIKEQWVIGLSESESLGNRTNNRVESLNQKIKQVIDRNAKFDAFAADLVNFLHMHRTEINGKICKTVNKVSTKGASDGTADGQCRHVCTEYAYKLVEAQIQKSKSVQVTETWDQFSCSSDNQEYSLTETSCTCDFHKQYRLPCKHVLAVRTRKDMNLFSDDLIDSRWTKAKYLGILNQTATENEIQTVGTSPARKPSSQQERFRKCFRIAQRIASVTAEYTGTTYDVKINQLQELLSAWENGQNIVLSTVENNNVDDIEPQSAEIEGAAAVASEPTTESDDQNQNDESDDVSNIATPQNVLPTDNDEELVNDNTVQDQVAAVTTENNTTDTDAANMLLQLAAGAVATGREHESRENLQTETVLPTTTTARERTTNVLSDIADIALPPRIQKRGRPKGSELTVIGLPKKRLKLHKSKCVAFERMSDIQKQIFRAFLVC